MIAEEKVEEKKEQVEEVSESVVAAAPREESVGSKAFSNVEMFKKIRPGYTVAVSQTILQGDKERIQVFEGIVIAKRGKNPVEKTITVRKIAAGGIGVEKIFPISAPTVKEIRITHEGRARRSKLYFLRGSLKKMRELREK